MTKSTTRETADVANIAGRKNLIINGGFDVWQRGTSHNPNSLRYGSADRWWTWQSTTTHTVSQQSVGTNGYYDLKWTTGEAGGVDLRHGVELTNARPITNGGKLTFSFYASFPIGSDVRVTLAYADTMSLANASYLTNYTNLGVGTGAYTRYVVAVNDVVPNWSNKMLCCLISGGSVSSSHYISNVQLELGSVATDFEHRSYGEELALCQRYYQMVSDKFTSQGTRWSTVYYGSYYMPVTMRSAPDFLGSREGMFKAFGLGAALDSTSVYPGEAGQNSIELIATTGDVGVSAFIRFAASTDWFSLDAEL